jgi:hypothetical protein
MMKPLVFWLLALGLLTPIAARSLPAKATGDQLRHTCVFDNHPENQPFINGVQRQLQYLVWGERSLDKMCVSVHSTSAR